MAFDQDSDKPLVDPHKRTTKVNISMIIGVIVFFLAGAAAVYWYQAHPRKTVPAAEQR